MVPEEITVQRPVTVYRTIPIGTSVAWVPFGSTTATAALPAACLRIEWACAAERKKRSNDSARRSSRKRVLKMESYERDKIERREGADLLDEAAPGNLGGKRSEIVIPQRKSSDATGPQQVSQRVPSAVLMNGWMVRHRAASPEAQDASGSVSVADAKK